LRKSDKPRLVCKVAEGEIGKKCSGPLHRDGVWLTYKSFWKNAARSDGYQSVCIECSKIEGAKSQDRIKRYQERSGRRLSKVVGADAILERFVAGDRADEVLKEFVDG